MFQNNLLMAAASISTDAAYTIDYSCRFDRATTSRLTRTVDATATDGSKAVIGGWFKKSGQALTQTLFDSSGQDWLIDFNASDQLMTTDSGYEVYITTQVFRDPNAWYHFIGSYDSDQTVVGDRWLTYINGELITDFSTYGFSQIADGEAFGHTVDTNVTAIGSSYNDYRWWDGYMSQCFCVDGLSIQNGDFSIASFGEFNNNVWRPIDLTGLTFGNNGYLLDFADSSALGNDVSGNDNDWTPDSMAADDQVTDTPTTNYCTWSSLSPATTAPLKNGNLQPSSGSYGAWVQATMGVSSGKWFFVIGTETNDDANHIGIMAKPEMISTTYPTAGAFGWGVGGGGTTTIKTQNAGSNITGTVDTIDNSNDLWCVAFDADNKKLWFGIWDNSDTQLEWLGSDGTMRTSDEPGAGTNQTYTVTGSTWLPFFEGDSDNNQQTNFGQLSFPGSLSLPSGFKELNTSNLAEPTIKNSKKYYDTILYEGNGTGQKIGQFQPITESYSVGNSAMFDGSDDKLTRTFDSGGDRKKWTISFWYKRCGALNSRQSIFSASGSYLQVGPDAGYEEEIVLYNSGGSGTGLNWLTYRRFGDRTQWVNVVWSFDSAQDAAADRTTLSIDGVEVPAAGFSKIADVSEDYEGAINNNIEHALGNYAAYNFPFNGYLAEICFIDSAVLAASSFGEIDSTTNRWVPKDVSGLTFGTTGFYLDMADGNALGDDESGNTNDWAMVNMDTTNKSNQFYDSPTRNSPTFGSRSVGTTSKGDLTQTSPASQVGWGVVSQAFGLTSGKYYWEAVLDSGSTGNNNMFGMLQNDVAPVADVRFNGGTGHYVAYYSTDGNIMTPGDVTSITPESTAYGDTWTTGDVISCAVDLDIGAVWFAKNGTWQESATEAEIEAGDTSNAAQSGMASGAWYPAINTNNGWVSTGNFGQHIYFDSTALTLDSDAGGYFRHDVPEGFKAINVDNLAESDSFISGFSWIKNREQADNHMLFDRVRGIYNDLHSNTTDIQVTNRDTLQRFLKQGATIGEDVQVNTLNESYVYWDWFIEATGSGSSNEDGSINTISTLVDTTSGLSISTYVGTGANATVGHGLGAIPKMMLVKTVDTGVSNWTVYHASNPATSYLYLDLTTALLTAATVWNSTRPTSTVFSIGSAGITNSSGYTMLCYAFAEVEGFSKFGVFEGNALDDGPVIYTGFRPAWVMMKDIDAAGGHEWWIFDSARSPFNQGDITIGANDSRAETSDVDRAFDFLSNGFKLRDSHVEWNPSNTIIFAAFAQNPFGGASTTPATAV